MKNTSGQSTGHSNGATRSDLLTEDEAAAYLNVSKRTIQSWRYEGRLRYVKLAPRAVRIRRVDLDAMVTAGLTAPSDS